LLAEAPLRRRMGRASREIARTHDAAVTLAEFEDRYISLGHLCWWIPPAAWSVS